MADYYSVLRRAIDSLRPNTEETRKVLYERARATLVAQLAGLNPPASDTQVAEQQNQLANAVARIEEEFAAGPAADAAPEPDTAPADAPSATPAAAEPAPPSAPPPFPPAAPASRPSAAPLADTAPRQPMETPRAPSFGAPPSTGPELAPPAPFTAAPTAPAPPADIPSAESPAIVDHGPARDPAAPTGDAAPAPQPAPLAGSRLTTDLSQDGFVDDPFLEDGGKPIKRRSAWVAPLIIVLLLGIVGGAGYVFRGPLMEWANNLAATIQTGGQDDGEKIEERIGGTQEPDVETDIVVEAEQPTPDASEAIGQVAEAQLIEQNEADPNEPLRSPGSVRWFTETENGETVLIGVVDVPSKGLSMSMTFRNNTDPTFPATHTVTFQFSLGPNFENGGIQDVPRLLLKQTAQSPGTPLVTDVIQVDENVFLMALSGVDLDAERNISELKTRPFIDVPLVYTDGRLAILTLAKGTDGDQAFSTAFAAWGQ